MLDPIFTNGVIAVKERLLLGDKLLRFCEMTAEEVLRALIESGFGSGAESHDGESLCESEERSLDSFIREHAPSKTELTYLLAPRDFHNAKAICKSVKLGTEAEKMLAPEGLIPVADISAAIKGGNFDALGKELGGAVREVLENDELTGAEIGAAFDIALYKRLSAVCGRNALLKKLLAGRADRLNILTAMRSGDSEHAEKLYVGGGKLKLRELARLFDGDATVLKGTPYNDFYALCLSAKEKGMPFTAAERALESFEAEYFHEKRYELEGRKPFLYYVFRRRAEIGNVRIILVCLNAGLSEHDVKRRLRAV